MTMSLYSELRREWLLWWAYRVNAVSSLIMWGAIFPILLITVQSVANNSGVPFGPEEQAQSLIGFIVWKLCMGLLVAIPEMVEEEARTGTLESVLLASSLPFHTLFFYRILARSLRSLLETLLLTIALVLIFRLPLSFSPTAWVVSGLTLAGIWGVGYAVAGLSLIQKAVSSVTGLLANLAFLISGALVPLEPLGEFYTFLKLIFPMTWGIEILRDVMLDGVTLGESIRSGALLGLAAQTTIFLFLGLRVFTAAIRQTRRSGELGTY